VAPTDPGVSLAYDTAVKKLEQQRRDIDQLDTKAAAMIGLLGVVVGGYIVGAKTDFERWGGGALVLASVLCTLYAYSIRNYADAPKVRTFARYANLPPDEMQDVFLGAVLDAIDWNAPRVRWKGWAINASFALLTILAISIAVIVAWKLDPRV